MEGEEAGSPSAKEVLGWPCLHRVAIILSLVLQAGVVILLSISEEP